MGFFEDTKPPERLPPQVIQQSQWWPAAIVLALLTGIGIFLGWILKPLLTYLFTFEGRTSNQKKNQILIITILFLGPPVGLYISSPTVRDWVSLSKTHTLNYSRHGERIFFPESSYFVPEGMRRGITSGSKTYITYAGYTKNVMQKINPSNCQMVPRSNRMGLASIDPPDIAEGFEDEVTYTTIQSISSLTGLRYIKERMIRPSTWFNEAKLETIMVEHEKTSSWKNFIDDWRLIWKFESGHRAFETKARSNEHAIICF